MAFKNVGRVILCYAPWSSVITEDRTVNLTPTELKTDTSVVQQESGWKRLKRMYSTDEFGNLSSEANTILEIGAFSTFIGALYGGILQSRMAYMDFMTNNQATSFANHFEAKKKLQDKVTLGFGKGAFKWGWRLTLFSTSFIGIATTLAVYRGKNGVLEYVGAGVLTGALYKFNMGPRGWIVGGGLGAILGLVGGGTTYGLLKMTGMTMDDVRYWQHHWQEKRMEKFNEGVAEYMQREELQIVKDRNKKEDTVDITKLK